MRTVRVEPLGQSFLLSMASAPGPENCVPTTLLRGGSESWLQTWVLLKSTGADAVALAGVLFNLLTGALPLEWRAAIASASVLVAEGGAIARGRSV